LFGRNFVDVFGTKFITSYLHALIYHTGDFLEMLKFSLDRIANFGIEKRHKLKNPIKSIEL